MAHSKAAAFRVSRQPQPTAHDEQPGQPRRQVRYARQPQQRGTRRGLPVVNHAPRRPPGHDPREQSEQQHVRRQVQAEIEKRVDRLTGQGEDSGHAPGVVGAGRLGLQQPPGGHPQQADRGQHQAQPHHARLDQRLEVLVLRVVVPRVVGRRLVQPVDIAVRPQAAAQTPELARRAQAGLPVPQTAIRRLVGVMQQRGQPGLHRSAAANPPYQTEAEQQDQHEPGQLTAKPARHRDRQRGHDGRGRHGHPRAPRERAKDARDEASGQTERHQRAGVQRGQEHQNLLAPGHHPVTGSLAGVAGQAQNDQAQRRRQT